MQAKDFLHRYKGRTATDSAKCGRCRHFLNSPDSLETHLPGLQCMGSGYSSVRDRDGLCAIHDRYLSADSVCDAYQAG